MRYLKDVREGETIIETYLCKKKQALKTKNGKSYYSLILQDKTGTMDTKIWNLSSGIDNFEELDYVHVEAVVTSFQGALQMSVQRLRVSQEGEYDPADFMPMSEYDPEKMYEELLAIANTVKEPHLRRLLELFFVENKELSKAFKKHSAAKSVHHGFVGGLLEHTLSVVRLCEFFAKQYPILNRDLLVTAAMLHDIGKMKELSVFPANDYTDEGQLLGHIYIGTEWIHDEIAKIPGFPKKLASELKHCILAHHGELEYGSPKKPAIAEAFALHFADNMDAKMETLKELFQTNPDSCEWLGYQKLLETNVRRTGGK
jgi:3'-5' exoribonuclease